MSKVLIVDDSAIDQLMIVNILEQYDITTADDGVEALEALDRDDEIEIMILDLNMPRMNGFEVLAHIRSDYKERDIAVLILTNYEEIENEIKGLDLGAVDYIRKPLNADSLKKRLEVHWNLMRAKKEIRIYSEHLEEMVQKRTEELELTRDITINALIGLLEVRDIESSNHTRRTQWMMKVLSQHLKEKELFLSELTDVKIQELFKTAPLHDIGKVGISDSILLKPSKLTYQEYEIMKEHVRYGVEALTSQAIKEEMATFIKTAVNIVSAHHEKYDGSGYPKGLAGDDIPLEGRLMAIIDVYDAVTSKRVYKDAYEHEYALDIIRSERGKHFDPLIADAFLEIGDEIFALSQKYKAQNGDYYNQK